MSLDLTSCGHLRRDSKGELVFCDKCRPKPLPNPALEEQMTHQAKTITDDINKMMETWLTNDFQGSIVAGCLLGAAAGIAQEIGVTKEQFLSHLKEFWP